MAHYLLIAHFLICIVIVGTIFGVLGGATVDPDNIIDGQSPSVTPRLWFKVTPGNVNAIVTAALVLVRVITTSWSSTVAWKSAFMLMEKGEIDLRQLNTMISWKLFRPVKLMGWISSVCEMVFTKAPARHHKPKAMKAKSNYGFYVAVILLAMWPATLSAPLLSSSVEWLQSKYGSGDHEEQLYFDSQGTGLNVSGIAWRRYPGYNFAARAIHDLIVDASLEVVAIENLTSNYQAQPKPNHCFLTTLLEDLGYTPDVTVTQQQKLTIPCIKTGIIRWSENSTQINATRHMLADPIRATRKWLRAAQIGAVKLIHSNGYPWWPEMENVNIGYQQCLHGDTRAITDAKRKRECLVPMPKMESFSGTTQIIMIVSRYSKISGCGTVSENFGSESGARNIDKAQVFTLNDPRPGTPCFITGDIDMNSGVTKVEHSKNPSSNYSEILSPEVFESNRWTRTVLSDLVPDVLTGMAIGNIIRTIARWNNVDAYVELIIHEAYSVAWAVFSFYISRPETISMPIIEAKVNPTRLFSWLALNILFTISGIFHILLQSTSSRPVIVDTAAVALTTDVSKLLDDADVKERNWRNMKSVSKQDEFVYDDNGKPAERILLKLEPVDDEFVLVRKNA